MEVLDAMTGKRDQRIWAVAQGQDLKVDDSDTPPFIPVKTNIPGKGPNGEHIFLDGTEAIAQMTTLPARRLGWTDRGVIKVGCWADLVLLKAEEVRDEATIQTPHRYAVGIEHVLVNGTEIAAHGSFTGELPGTLLRSGTNTDTVTVPGASR